MSSLRQILANRQNAQKSTGPKSAEGKAQSRRNALKHGLAGQGIVWPEEQGAAVASRVDQWTEELEPATDYARWLVSVMATEALRFDLAQSAENDLQAWLAQRASGCWESDRQLEVEELAGRLGSRPALTVARLRQSAQGVAWLIALWQALGQALQDPDGWTEIERSLALDLLGIPRELRRDGTPLEPAAGQSETEAAAALVASELAALEQLKVDALDSLDVLERSAAERGLAVHPDRRLLLLRRYQAACFRRLQWAVRELRASHRGESATPVCVRFEPEPEAAVEVIEAARPEPLPEPSRPAELFLEPPAPFSASPVATAPIDLTTSWPDLLQTPSRADRRQRRRRLEKKRRRR